jgi:hypothetical protein
MNQVHGISLALANHLMNFLFSQPSSQLCDQKQVSLLD